VSISVRQTEHASDWSPMIYTNSAMRIDQIVGYFNEEKINLNPVFQRGHRWPLIFRRKLLVNMVMGRPIPAIFLYKEAEGARFSYNILDGKQRLESLILFIGSQREGLAIANWFKYFDVPYRAQGNFWIQLPEGKRAFKALDDQLVRNFTEYSIPTVEITLSDSSHLDEIISLFVDINQQGVAVSRFDVVKAMGENNPLLQSIFKLMAIKQRLGHDSVYVSRRTDITQVLKTLSVIANAADRRSQVDRMWERLLEVVLFYRTRQHRKAVDILKSFIRAGRQAKSAPGDDVTLAKLTTPEAKGLTKIFRFVNMAIKKNRLGETPLTTDQTHFYTLITSLIATDIMKRFESDLPARLLTLGRIIKSGHAASKSREFSKTFKRYMDLSSDRTTDTPRREERQDKFIELVSWL